jgi:hypothetical protein
MSGGTLRLRCPYCGWWPRDNLTAGLLAAHYDTEHPSEPVRLGLVMRCDHCAEPMELTRTETTTTGRRLHYTCEGCHRSARQFQRDTSL